MGNICIKKGIIRYRGSPPDSDYMSLYISRPRFIGFYRDKRWTIDRVVGRPNSPWVGQKADFNKYIRRNSRDKVVGDHFYGIGPNRRRSRGFEKEIRVTIHN